MLSVLCERGSWKVLQEIGHGRRTTAGVATRTAIPVDHVVVLLGRLVEAGVLEPPTIGVQTDGHEYQLTRAATELLVGLRRG